MTTARLRNNRRVRLVIVLAAGCLLLAQVSAAQAAPCDPNMDYAAEGDRLASAGDQDAAADAYACALAAEPQNTRLLLARAESLVQSGHYLTAISPYMRLADYFPDVLDARIAELREQVAADPGNLTLLQLLANASYRANNDAAEEMVDLTAYHEAAPDAPDAIILYVTADPAFGEYGSNVRDAVLRAVELEGENGETTGFLGYSEGLFGGDVEGGLNLLNGAIESAPSAALLYWARAVVELNAAGDPAAALESLQAGLAADPSDLWTIRELLRGSGSGAFTPDEATLESAVASYQAIVPADNSDGYLFPAYAWIGAGFPERGAQLIADYVASLGDAVVDAGALTSSERSIVDIDDGSAFRFTLDSAAGRQWTVTVNPARGFSDPNVAILAPDGSPLTANDDVDSANSQANSEATFTAPADGTYTVLVTYVPPASGQLVVTATAAE